MSEQAAFIPTVHARETVFRSRQFDVERATLDLPGGGAVDRLTVIHPGAVAMVAIDGEGRWLLVRQYRHAAGRVLLEIPAGTREPGEHPDATAHRELREETGYAAGRLERLGGAWMAPGFTSEFIDFYLATELRPDPLPADADEGLSAPIPFARAAIEAAVQAGEIDDAKTLVALALVRAREAVGG